MSTQSNRKWSRIDQRRARAYELLESWINGNHEHVLRELETAGQARRLLAALVCVAVEGGHGDRYIRPLQAICDRIYRER